MLMRGKHGVLDVAALAIGGASFISLIYVMYNLSIYPLQPGRLMLYIFLIIPLLLVIYDSLRTYFRRSNGSKWSTRKELLVFTLAFIVLFITGYIITSVFTKSLLSGSSSWLGTMYPGDLGSLVVALTPLTMYIVLDLIESLARYFRAKCSELLDQGS